jgi:hypothetical protein
VPLNPAPIIEANILLVSQNLLRSDMSRAAQLEFGLLCADSTQATYQDAIDDFQTNFNTQWGPHLDTEVSILPPVGRGGDGTNVPLLVIAAGAAIAGANASTNMPPNVALLIRKRTSFGGRKNRGRNYYPFVLADTDVSENGTVATLSVAAFQASATAFLAQLSTDVTPLCIENKTYNTPLPPHYVTEISLSAAQVQAYTVETVIATQRRRLGR